MSERFNVIIRRDETGWYTVTAWFRYLPKFVAREFHGYGPTEEAALAETIARIKRHDSERRAREQAKKSKRRTVIEVDFPA